MNDKEIREMQRRIDEGIRIAHRRLLERAGCNRQTLVVFRGGKLTELIPDGMEATMVCTREGDPLARRRDK